MRLDGIEEVLLRKWWRSKARRDPFSGAAGLPASFARGRHPARLAHRSFACDRYRRLGAQGRTFSSLDGQCLPRGFRQVRQQSMMGICVLRLPAHRKFFLRVDRRLDNGIRNFCGWSIAGCAAVWPLLQRRANIPRRSVTLPLFSSTGSSFGLRRRELEASNSGLGSAWSLRFSSKNSPRTLWKDSGLPTKGFTAILTAARITSERSNNRSALTLGRRQNASCRRPCSSNNNSTVNGVLAQLVERLNGIEEVRGSNPLGSTICGGVSRSERFEPWFDYPRDSAILGRSQFRRARRSRDNPLGSTIYGGVSRSERFEPWFDYPRFCASSEQATPVGATTSG